MDILKVVQLNQEQFQIPPTNSIEIFGKAEKMSISDQDILTLEGSYVPKNILLTGGAGFMYVVFFVLYLCKYCFDV